MARMALSILALLIFAPAAWAAPSWALISFSTTPENAPAVVAAADALMSSPVGKEFPGQLLLQQNTANGADPSTHSFVPIYKSMAEREAYVAKLQASPAWMKFTKRLADLTQPVSQVSYRTIGSWSDVNDQDTVWMAHAFRVSDLPAFRKAIERFMASDTGKKFPGQVYLSEVVAAGPSPVTHVISVGYASEAELESWLDVRDASADWASYLGASRAASEYLGANLARTVKRYGPASLEQIVGR